MTLPGILSPFDRSLKPLLEGLKWHGTERHFKEALPHYSNIETATMFCEVMKNLDYETTSFKTCLGNIDSRLFPCLFETEENSIFLLLEETTETLKIWDGQKNAEIIINKPWISAQQKGCAYVFKKIKEKVIVPSREKKGLGLLLQENKTLIYSTLGLSLILNLLSLGPPLFIMAVYNNIIATRSISTLYQFLIGVFCVLIGMAFIYRIRSQMLALLGTKLDQQIGKQIFERLLYLPPIYTESGAVSTQVARLKDFDKLRDFFSGPLLTAFFEVPFIVFSLLVIGILGGNLVFVPLTLILLFGLLALLFFPKMKQKFEKTTITHTEQQSCLIETVQNLRAIKYLSIEKTWQKQYREYSAKAVLANLQTGFLTVVNLVISDMLMVISGMLVIGFGAIKIMLNTISVGATLAIMILAWRSLTPLKTLFNTLPNLLQIQNSITQIARLMKIKPETNLKELLKIDYQKFVGHIRFNRVSFRYHPTSDPALLGVTFKIKPGSLVGIAGPNGSGKSTLLKLILSLYQAQSGNIFIENHDIRQFNPVELRSIISYLPQQPELFYGTITQNLRLAEPTATEEELLEAVQKAGILEEILQLPEGFSTRLKENHALLLSASFQQKLSLSRLYLRKGPILLLDEPSTGLDPKSDEQLLKTLLEYRGKKTIVIASHRASYLKHMDQVLVLDQGQLVLIGSPEKVLIKIPKDLQ